MAIKYLFKVENVLIPDNNMIKRKQMKELQLWSPAIINFEWKALHIKGIKCLKFRSSIFIPSLLPGLINVYYKKIIRVHNIVNYIFFLLPSAKFKISRLREHFQAAVINDFCACLLCLFNLFRKTFLSPACIAALCSYYQPLFRKTFLHWNAARPKNGPKFDEHNAH